MSCAFAFTLFTVFPWWVTFINIVRVQNNTIVTSNVGTFQYMKLYTALVNCKFEGQICKNLVLNKLYCQRNHSRISLFFSLQKIVLLCETNEFLVCKKIVVLRRWESETGKFGFIKHVDKLRSNYHHERFGKLTFRGVKPFVRGNRGINCGCCWFLCGCGRALPLVEIW